MELLVPFSVLQELVVVLVEAGQIQEEVVAGSLRQVGMVLEGQQELEGLVVQEVLEALVV